MEMIRLAFKYNYFLTFVCFFIQLSFTLQMEWNLDDFLRKEHSLVKPYGSESNLNIVISSKNSNKTCFLSDCCRHPELGLCR